MPARARGGEAGSHDGPRGSAREDIAFAGEQPISEIDGAPRGGELAGEAPRRGQPFPGRKRPPPDRLAQALIDLPIERGGRCAVEIDLEPLETAAARPGAVRHEGKA